MREGCSELCWSPYKSVVSCESLHVFLRPTHDVVCGHGTFSLEAISLYSISLFSFISYFKKIPNVNCFNFYCLHIHLWHFSFYPGRRDISYYFSVWISYLCSRSYSDPCTASFFLLSNLLECNYKIRTAYK